MNNTTAIDKEVGTDIDKLKREDKKLVRDYTFEPWRKGYSSEVLKINKKVLEKEGYESTYTFMFNYLKESGWEFIDKGWCGPNRAIKFGTIGKAYESQRLWESTQGYKDHE